VLAESHHEDQIIARVAALDIGKAVLVCYLRVPAEGSSGKRLQEVSAHSTMTRSLTELANRLVELRVERVVMEATSDYWKPVFYLLEAHGLDPWLVNARDVKHLPGRPKTDVLDAVWLCSSVSRSRALFRAILAVHQSELDFDGRACSGQPCQKQPSTKTAIFRDLKRTSTSRRSSGIALTCFRKRSPFRASALRRRVSGSVSRRVCRCILCRVLAVGGSACGDTTCGTQRARVATPDLPVQPPAHPAGGMTRPNDLRVNG
jgi:hypothetical protein